MRGSTGQGRPSINAAGIQITFMDLSNFAVIIALIGVPGIVINLIDRKPIVITGRLGHQTVHVDHSWLRMSGPSYDIHTIRNTL